MNDSATESSVWSAPISQLAGDVLVFALLCAVFLVPAACLGGMRGLMATLACLLFAAILATPPAWQLRLEEESLLVGIGRWGARIAFDSVSSVGAFRNVGDRSTFDLDGKKGSYPLRIEARGRTVAIRLRRADAQEAVDRLRARCRHATFVDTEGVSHLPIEQADLASGLTRLNRFWGRQAIAAFVVGAALSVGSLHALLAIWFGKGGSEGTSTAGELRAWVLFSCSGAILRFGVQCWHRRGVSLARA